VAEEEVHAVSHHGVLHLRLNVKSRLHVDLGDPHRAQGLGRIAVEADGRGVRVDDVAAYGVDQQLDRGRLLEQGSEAALALAQRPLGLAARLVGARE
jgi:hypothetical protein